MWASSYPGWARCEVQHRPLGTSSGWRGSWRMPRMTKPSVQTPRRVSLRSGHRERKHGRREDVMPAASGNEMLWRPRNRPHAGYRAHASVPLSTYQGGSTTFHVAIACAHRVSQTGSRSCESLIDELCPATSVVSRQVHWQAGALRLCISHMCCRCQCRCRRCCCGCCFPQRDPAGTFRVGTCFT